MPRTKQMLSFAAAGGTPKLTISRPDWDRIETAYGHQLGASVRRRVRASTREYLDWADYEQRAEPIAASRSRICEIKKAAREFQQRIFIYPPRIGRQADYYARRLICNHLGRDFEKGRDGLQNLAFHVQQEISKACNRALADLGSQENSGFRRGEMWELWVRKLTTILSEAELPTPVRKDADKTNAAKPSAFVSFLRELQERMYPEGLQKITGSRARFWGQYRPLGGYRASAAVCPSGHKDPLRSQK